jgi:hypothetical protein
MSLYLKKEFARFWADIQQRINLEVHHSNRKLLDYYLDRKVRLLDPDKNPIAPKLYLGS